jgi:DNA-binding transcriptional LysR family regulator
MLDGLKSLISVEKFGTISQAAVALRLTQSAVTKRIQALEQELGYAVVEKDGRRIRLTMAAQELLSRAKPLVAELESLRFSAFTEPRREFSLGVADSIAASWGPAALRRVLRAIPGLKFELHVHRSMLILENVRLGRYDLGLVTARNSGADLVSHELAREEMVLVGSHRDPVLTIEPVSATWREIGSMVREHSQLRERPREFVESFPAAAQMARQGFGQALVPLGVARALGFGPKTVTRLSPRLTRGIQLVFRKATGEQPLIKRLAKELPGAIGNFHGG